MLVFSDSSKYSFDEFFLISLGLFCLINNFTNLKIRISCDTNNYHYYEDTTNV